MKNHINFTVVKIETCIFDIDGTISFDNSPVNDRLTEHLLKLANKKHVIFATARPLRDVLQVLPKSLQNQTILCTNGSLLYKGGSLLNNINISSETVKKLSSLFDETNTPHILDTCKGANLSKDQHKFFKYTKSTADCPFISKAEALEIGINKIQVFNNSLIAVINNMKTIKGITIHPYQDVDFFDISPTPSCKSNIFEMLDIDPSTCISFGNDSNDIELLKKSGLSISIGSLPQLSEVSNIQISKNRAEKGIAEIITRILNETL